MDIKELKKLNREELLELLLEQTQRNDELERQLNEKKIAIENAGSIAEASLALSKVFEAAQEAADTYLANIYGTYPESNNILEGIDIEEDLFDDED